MKKSPGKVSSKTKLSESVGVKDEEGTAVDEEQLVPVKVRQNRLLMRLVCSKSVTASIEVKQDSLYCT